MYKWVWYVNEAIFVVVSFEYGQFNNINFMHNFGYHSWILVLILILLKYQTHNTRKFKLIHLSLSFCLFYSMASLYQFFSSIILLILSLYCSFQYSKDSFNIWSIDFDCLMIFINWNWIFYVKSYLRASVFPWQTVSREVEVNLKINKINWKLTKRMNKQNLLIRRTFNCFKNLQHFTIKIDFFLLINTIVKSIKYSELIIIIGIDDVACMTDHVSFFLPFVSLARSLSLYFTCIKNAINILYA